MKINLLKKLCLFCCFTTLSMFGQVTYTGLKKDYTQSMDSLLTFVNKAPVTTGILYDRVMSFSSLNMLKENGVITKSNYQHFIQSWSELHRSAYNPTFVSLETLKTNINANTNQNIVDIGIINTKINYIDYGTTTTPSLNFANGYFANISGINPFLENQVTVIAPLKEKATSGTVTFRLSPSFLLQLTGLPIKNLIADFGTGTNYNLITDQVISTTNPTVTYATSGKKECVFTVTFSNNTTETLKATLEIQLPPAETYVIGDKRSFPLEEDFVGSNGINTSTPNNTIAFQGYNETTPIKGILEYRTYYNLATNNGSAVSKINKPVIILDGYDPGDGRKIYPQSIGYNQDKKSLYELMLYDDDNNSATVPANLVEKLRSAAYGFDVTLVNFPKGADYIERNAMALVALLQRENQKLLDNGSTEKITIIGPSMGGLVSRYALAYMEKNNIPHNTKLWISFDSPHLGANIPIGAQENLYFYGYTGRQDQAKIKFDENFRSPAARQMLIEQLDGKHEAAPYPSSLWSNSVNGQNNNTPFRQQFTNNLTSNGLNGSYGFPQNLRKIALINGTTNGTKTNNPGNKFLELAAFTIIKYGQIFGTPIQTKIKVASINDTFLGNPSTTNQTFSGKVTIKRVAGIEVHNGSVTRTNNNQRGSMDIVQGGTYNTQGIIKDEFTAALNDAVDSQEWRTYLPNHAFIPSVSALAFKNSNFDWSAAINRNLVCDPLNKEIYFDTYFAPSKNEEHVFVTADNVNWLLKEIQGIPQAPYFPVSESALNGPSNVCKDINATYTFSDLCKIPGRVTSWSFIGNLAIVTSSDYSVTVKGTSDVFAEGRIIALFENGVKLEKIISTGKPNVTNTTISGGYANTPINTSTTFSVAAVPGATEYYWYITLNPNCNCYTDSNGLTICPQGTVMPKFTSSNTTTLTTSYPSASIQWGNCPGFYAVNCIAKNSCSSSGIGFKGVQLYDPYAGGGGTDPCPTALKLYPNPTKNGTVVVNIRDPWGDPCPVVGKGDTQNQIKIYDFYGNLIYDEKFTSSDLTISTAKFKKGKYVVNLFTPGGKTKKQILIVD